jgi:hypothetical protein
MTIIPQPPGSNGHVHPSGGDLPLRLAERYAAGATLDQLAVEFHMAPSRCRRLLLQAGATLRPLTPPRPAAWFDPAAIPLERQREIAEAYRAFPGHEVAAAYGLPLPWVQKIARLHGVRKAAPRGYRKQRGSARGARTPAPAPVQRYVATLVVEAQLEAPGWEAAVAHLRQAGTAIQVVRVCAVQRLVAADSETRQP